MNTKKITSLILAGLLSTSMINAYASNNTDGIEEYCIPVQRDIENNIEDAMETLESDIPYSERVQALMGQDTSETDTLSIQSTDDRYEAVSKETDEILKQMARANITGDLQKAMWLHNYIALHCEGRNSTKDTTVANVLIDGWGTATGYSLTYKHLLDEVGIENELVYSDTCNTVWNLVQIDGVWYHVDVYKDDPIPDYMGYARYKYFLASTKKINADYCHYNWYLDEGVDIDVDSIGTKYDDVLWREATSIIALNESDGYFVYQDEEVWDYHLYSMTDDFTDYTELTELDVRWYYPPKPGAFWAGWYGGLSYYNGSLYYNVYKDIVRLGLNNLTPDVVYHTEGYDWGIYGSYLEGTTLYYTCGNMQAGGVHDGTLNGAADVFDIITDATHDYELTITRAGKCSGGTGIELKGYFLSATVENSTDKDVTAVFYYAVYDNKGVLYNLEVKERTVPANGTFKLEFPLDEDYPRTYRETIFAFDSNDTLHPLMEAFDATKY